MPSRDVTKLLAAVEKADAKTDRAIVLLSDVMGLLGNVKQVARDIDARTGKRDPSKRQKKGKLAGSTDGY